MPASLQYDGRGDWVPARAGHRLLTQGPQGPLLPPHPAPQSTLGPKGTFDCMSSLGAKGGKASEGPSESQEGIVGAQVS